MKRNAIVISVFTLVILCCVLGVIWYDRSSRRPDSIRESRVSQLPDEVETPEISTGDGQAEDSTDTEGDSQGGEAAPTRRKFQNQIPDYAKLTEKQQAQLREQSGSRKPVVRLYGKEPQIPADMHMYQCTKLNMNDMSIRQTVFGVVKQALSENPGKMQYTPQVLPDDFTEENLLDDMDAVTQYCSKEEPYTIIFGQDETYFLLDKNYYDTRISLQQRYPLTQKFACRRAGRLSEKLIHELDLGCKAAQKKDWRIEGHVSNEDAADGLNYRNGVSEGYYKMEIPFTVDGYPIASSFGENPELNRVQYPISMEISYSETGLAYMYGMIGCSFKRLGKVYGNLLPARDAAQKITGFLADKKENAVIGISHMRLSYAVVEKKGQKKGLQVRPVWELYGFKQSVGGGKCRYLVDAQTGEVYCEELAVSQ